MSKDNKTKLPREIWVMIIIGMLLFFIVILVFVIEALKDKPDVPTLLQSSMIGIVCSLVASIMYTIMQRIFSNNDEKELEVSLKKIEECLNLQDDLYDSGIRGIRPKQYFDNEEMYWNELIHGTHKRLDLIGHSISKWFRGEYKTTFISKLKRMLKKGYVVNIILSARNIDYEKIIDVFDKKYEENRLNKIEKTILYLCQMVQDIPKEKHKYLKVYVNDLEKVTYLYIRTDQQCIISPYMYSGDSNNSFLLELKPSTPYAKTLEDDFDKMKSYLEPIDVSLDKYRKNKGQLTFLKKEETENNYSGSNWDFEKTEKYIFVDGNRKYEVGYFEHYAKKSLVKTVIELPVSYGCPSKCLFCASSNIQSFKTLNSQQLEYLFMHIYKLKKLHQQDRVLLSVTGMGDVFFNKDSVLAFLETLVNYKNLMITISSSFWEPELLKQVMSYKGRLAIRYVQLTYISTREEIVSKLVPLHDKRQILPSVMEYINYVEESDAKCFRINYIVIADINDSEEDIKAFIDITKKVKNKIMVRISKMNETNATKRNNLKPVEISRLQAIKEQLVNEGYQCYIFYSEKNDNMNCGQLITELP